MKLNEYQIKAITSAIYPGKGTGNYTYTTLGLCGEAGEVAEKIKKVLRDSNGLMSIETRKEVAKELGDCLWYISALAHEMHYTLEEIANINLAKLNNRKQRGVLGGSGDNR